MATIKLKRGTSTPTTSDLVNGEVALDLSAKKLYVNDAGTIKEIGSDAALSASQLNDINVVAGQVAHGTDLGSIADTLSSASGATAITTVSDNISDVVAVANDATDIGAVAANATNINAVNANSTNINTVATNITDVNTFTDRYQISSSAPTTRSDGSSLQDGDLWFNTTSDGMEAFDGSAGDGFTPIQPSQSTLQAINQVTGFVTFTEDNGLITDAINTGSGNNSINTVADDISNVNTVAGSISNVNTTAGSIANVNTVAGSITNVNNVGGSIADVNRYANEYVITGSAPSSPSAGDLWYNTSANQLNYYTGGAWVAIAPGIAGLVNDGAPQLASHLDCNNKNLTEVGTVSGDNLQIDFGTL